MRPVPSPRARRLRPLALALALGVVAVGCGDAGGAEGGLSGQIVISGSSTVEPISADVAERFNDANRGVDISVDGPGTGDGFELFCDGETDINNASTRIKPEQIADCEANGIEFVELHIGNDGIAVLTSPDNDAVECLTFADLYALLGPESQGVDRWREAQALAEELGSRTRLPNAPLDIVGPGEESGTFSSFVELVIEAFSEDRGEDATTRPDYQASADDNVIIQGVQGSDSSLGWVGFAFAELVRDVKVIAIAEAAGDECVEPTHETIADGSYPIARPLYIYVNAAEADENEALAAYVDFYLGDGIDAVSVVGYVDLADDDLDATRAHWASRTTGAR